MELLWPHADGLQQNPGKGPCIAPQGCFSLGPGTQVTSLFCSSPSSRPLVVCVGDSTQARKVH